MLKKKKIFLDEKKDKYCIVRVYSDINEMRAYHQNNGSSLTDDDELMWGCHLAFTRLEILEDGSERMINQTGTILLCFNYCGAGLVAHEFSHAVLWAWRHFNGKQQYPIVINNMEDEEEILRNQTYAIRQFYIWYWKIEKYFK